jgi:hypothetical protein
LTQAVSNQIRRDRRRRTKTKPEDERSKRNIKSDAGERGDIEKQ